MGRGDKKTKRGKINIGSYGVSRRRADNKKVAAPKAEVATPKAKKTTTKKAKAAKKSEE